MRTKKVILVGWDGADWKIASPLIDQGELPQLANIVENGASGPLASLPPYLSPMLWNSIATGKYADQHGILGFTTTDPTTGRMEAITSTQRKCKAVWNILSEQGLTSHVMGWFASHPAENVTGVCVTEAFPRPVAKGAEWPMPAGAVHPPELATEFAGLRLRPEDVDHGLLRLFIPRIDEIDLTKDKRPEQLAIRLAELYSVHNSAIAALDRGPCQFLAVYYHFIDWVCHDFMDFHPPRRPKVPEREFEWYQDVVRSAYRLSDLLLRDLLSHAGPDATVILCSDHGFHSDSRRPVRIPMVSAGIAIWHRAQGLFAAAGPGIARDALVEGATVLDITPTVLHLLGLPVGADMDGRVIAAACAPGTPGPKTIPSWESQPGPQPRPRHLTTLSKAEQAALLDQFAALGYVDLGNSGPVSPVQRNDRDNRWNLAITLRHAGRNEAALPLLQGLHLECPEDGRYALHYASCAQYLGLEEEASAAIETLVDYTPGDSQAHGILAEFERGRRNGAAALRQLEAARAATEQAKAAVASAGGPAAGDEPAPERWADSANFQVTRGQSLLQDGKILEACQVLRGAVELDDESPLAWLAFGQALLKAGQPADAETCARQAVALAPTMAMGHFTLAQTLVAQKRNTEAAESFRRARELNPRLIAANRALDRLQGRPFTVDTPNLTERLEEPPAIEALRAEAAARVAEHRGTLAKLRAGVQPVVRFEPPKPAASEGSAGKTDAAKQTLIVVSGLPRSGTSLMMQMLARGGLPPMTDGHRVADASNPEGYFEWEEIKRLPVEPQIIGRTAGKAVKVVSPLLPHLPANFRYKIIFMIRPATEVARSQHRMRAAADPAAPAPAAMEPLLRRHAEEVLAVLRKAKDVELLTVDYPELIADPAVGAHRVAEFLGSEVLPSASAMAGAVRPGLYREREGGV